MTSFQSGQFVKMLIGKLLCGIGRVHLEPAARLRFCSTPKSLIKNHKTPACAQWSSYLGCADMGKVKCARFNSWWTGTNNSKFHYLWAKGLCVVIVVKVKSKNWLPVLEWRWGGWLNIRTLTQIWISKVCSEIPAWKLSMLWFHYYSEYPCVLTFSLGVILVQ